MKKSIVILFVLFLFKSSLSVAQNEKFKALYMYNFTKYLEWPEVDREGDFIITVLGDHKFFEELNVIAQKKKVGFQPINVKIVSKIEEITRSHIIYIPPSQSKYIENIKSKFISNCTVIISDDLNGISKGAGINYITKGGKPLFEISKNNIVQHNVKVGSDLLSLGIQK